MLPPNIIGLTDEQVEELKLKDEWGEKCTPMDGFVFTKDPVGRQLHIFLMKLMISILNRNFVINNYHENWIILHLKYFQVVEMEKGQMKRCKKF